MKRLKAKTAHKNKPATIRTFSETRRLRNGTEPARQKTYTYISMMADRRIIPNTNPPGYNQ
jgi:hypothetical protein